MRLSNFLEPHQILTIYDETIVLKILRIHGLMAEQDIKEGKRSELPPFTLRNVLNDIYNGIFALFNDPFCTRIVCPVVIVLTSLLSKFIIYKVPYTEIDFRTYIQQIQIINEGELDYSLVKGDTGQIVYPAGFVQIYQFFNWLTDEGTNILTGQAAFGYLLSLTNFLIIIVYTMIPDFKPWPVYLLLLSKRLFSIYVLRLFNDCFTTVCMVSVTILLQQASYWYKKGGSSISFLLAMVAADLYSVAISIKMNALLYFPGIVIVAYFLCGENLFKLGIVLLVIPLVQVLMGWKFLLPFFNDEEASYIRWNYISQAFNFNRKFLYEWTVNWKFFSEEFFLSDIFSNGLLIANASTLLFFIVTRFISPKITGKSVSRLIKDAMVRPFNNTIHEDNLLIDYEYGPKMVMLILGSTNIIGILFARSLHYQFLSWYCWQLPFMLYMTGWSLLVCVPLWIVHEWCWNVFPSTPLSSASLVSILIVVLFGVWYNTSEWFPNKVFDESTIDESGESKKDK